VLIVSATIDGGVKGRINGARGRSDANGEGSGRFGVILLPQAAKTIGAKARQKRRVFYFS
jgi:hypothetical protein